MVPGAEPDELVVCQRIPASTRGSTLTFIYLLSVSGKESNPWRFDRSRPPD